MKSKKVKYYRVEFTKEDIDFYKEKEGRLYYKEYNINGSGWAKTKYKDIKSLMGNFFLM